MPGKSYGGETPKSGHSYPMVPNLEQIFTPTYRRGLPDDCIEVTLRKVNLLFHTWKKLGSTSAIRYVVNLRDEHITSGMLRLLEDHPEFWTYEMFHHLLPEMYRLSQNYDGRYLELAGGTMMFLIESFKPVIVNNLNKPGDNADSGRVRRHLMCKGTYERLLDIKMNLIRQRYKSFNTPIFTIYKVLIDIIQDLQDAPHR